MSGDLSLKSILKKINRQYSSLKLSDIIPWNSLKDCRGIANSPGKEKMLLSLSWIDFLRLFVDVCLTVLKNSNKPKKINAIVKQLSRDDSDLDFESPKPMPSTSGLCRPSVIQIPSHSEYNLLIIIGQYYLIP